MKIECPICHTKDPYLHSTDLKTWYCVHCDKSWDENKK